MAERRPGGGVASEITARAEVAVDGEVVAGSRRKAAGGGGSTRSGGEAMLVTGLPERKDVDYEVKVAQIDADIRILKLQEEIVQHDPEYAQGKHTSKLLRPSELIEMCMKRGRELSLKAFEVFAWTGSSFRSSNKGLLEACWANATDQDDWVELSQASVSKGWSDEVIQESLQGTDAVVFDDPFEEVLPVRKEDVHARGLEAKCFSVEEVLMQHDTFLDAGLEEVVRAGGGETRHGDWGRMAGPSRHFRKIC
ncbi:hypothetical protein ZWY2020_058710 [Hordeum vulgare]|nr:hypothetical protein ZWY2020_058710 [Hordeum vulgare]